jgi:hypothetical protein
MDSARHLPPDICPLISRIVLKNFIKNSLIIKECPEEILIKLAIVLKISRSSCLSETLLFPKLLVWSFDPQKKLCTMTR